MNKRFKILVGTDYSATAVNAAHYAIQLAKSTNSALYLMHVYSIPLTSIPSEATEFAKTREDFRTSELKILEQHFSQLFHELMVKEDELICEYIIHEGGIANQICAEAKGSNVDFIIVGTHGASGFRNVFFGTHAWEVIKKSAIPVLAIPKDGVFSSIKNIVFAAKQREDEIPVLNFLVQLAKRFDAEMTIVHITHDISAKTGETEMFENFRLKVKNKISYKKLIVQLANYEDIVQGLTDFCLRTKTDLLVMVHEKSSLLERIISGSSIKKMTFHTHIPLLSVPDYYVPEHPELQELSNLDEAI